MKVMTFNIRHGRMMTENKIDLSAIASVIREEQAELICLNEVYGKGPHPVFTDQAEQIAKELGYQAFYAPSIYLDQYGPYGNAFLSKYPIIDARNIKVPTVPRNHPGYFEDRAAFCAVVEVHSEKITVIGSHFGLQIEEQEECVKTVCHLIDESPYPVVLMGDFNVAPDSAVLQPIRERLSDTEPYLTGCPFTFASDKPEIKIDYIFVSKDFQVKDVRIPQHVVSDHFPMTCEITLP